MCSCKMKKKTRSSKKRRSTGRRRGRSVSGFGGGVPMVTLVAFGAGAVGSKALNGVLKNVQFVNNKPIVRPIIKLGLGYGMTAWKGGGEFVQNAGAGVIAEGVLDLLGVAAPNVFSKLTGEGVGSTGNTLIDLEDVSGYGNVDTGVAGYSDDIAVI